MKRLLSVTTGALLLLLPGVSMAQSLFDTFYDETAQTIDNGPVSDAITEFVIGQMRLWGPHGIVLTADDVRLAQRGDTKVCEGKKDRNGDAIASMNTGLGAYTCDGLKQAVQSLIESERQAQELGNTLITIANGNEMAIADEPHRGSNIGQSVATFSRLWTGTGSQIEPWPVAANAALTQLETALEEEKTDRDAIILRFHFGLFRDNREKDPRFDGVGPKTRAALVAIAAQLKMTGDSKKTGDIATPVLKTENVSLWARKDDVGLQWTYPTHLERFSIQAAWEYPERVEGGQLLAYPYAYQGELKPTSASTFFSPLCARTMGRSGFLCQPLPPTSTCDADSDSLTGISLTRCNSTITQTVGPLQLCSGSLLLYKDTGQAISDVKIDNKADPKTICTPETKILYPDDAAHHACYISYCVSQAFSGHTIIPLRNTTLATEPAAPFNAFARTDPQLGLYAEMNSVAAPFHLPPYLGLDLIAAFERDYCAQNGLPPGPLAGYCNYQNARRDASPQSNIAKNIRLYVSDAADLSSDFDQTSALGAAIGFRLSLDQSLPIYRTMTAALAQTVQNIANLFHELKTAPITRQLCPWIGAPVDSTNIPVEP